MTRELICKHFNGLVNDTCRVGVVYRDVRDDAAVGIRNRFPCWGQGATCNQYEQWTAQEIADREQRIMDSIHHLNNFTERQTEECPHCKQHVDSLEQVGRCVYANPCGCRVYQGRVPAFWERK